ncbi:MAG: hypothetical protein P3M75_00030 [Candidatus Hodgkinia cicadicola]|nr:MAG: hypothetical protein P3M75_00030 [Candidatus Hodgkinia cicadicola]
MRKRNLLHQRQPLIKTIRTEKEKKWLGTKFKRRKRRWRRCPNNKDNEHGTEETQSLQKTKQRTLALFQLDKDAQTPGREQL